MAATRPQAERFWEKVDKTENCWLWTACIKHGYGQFMVRRRSVMAHRWSYEHVNGPIPEGLDIDHLCRVRNCVNPAHLEAVSRRVNVLRGYGACAQFARKNACSNGHPYTEENTFYRSDGGRRCLICRKANSLAWYYRTDRERRRLERIARKAGR